METGGKIGYYQTFVYEGKEYAIGGWEGEEGTSVEFETAVKKHSGNSKCKVMVINGKEPDSEVLRKLLLFCAKQANATEKELTFIQNCDVGFELDDGMNLEEIEMKQQQNKGEKVIEIEYED